MADVTELVVMNLDQQLQIQYLNRFGAPRQILNFELWVLAVPAGSVLGFIQI